MSRPSTHRKQSISDKFQIGWGKYVHDIEFSQSIEPSTMGAIDEIDCERIIPCSSEKSHSSDDHSESKLSVIHKPGGENQRPFVLKQKLTMLVVVWEKNAKSIKIVGISTHNHKVQDLWGWWS